MHGRVKALVDAIRGRGERAVEVTPDGELRETDPAQANRPTGEDQAARGASAPAKEKATRLAPRTFGGATTNATGTSC